MAHEIEENKVEQKRLQGNNVVYGDKVQVSKNFFRETMVTVIIDSIINVVQFLHTASNRYLAVNATKTSRTENTSLRVSKDDIITKND